MELKDAKTGKYLHAKPEKAAFVVNVGDMLQRFSNGLSSPGMHSLFKVTGCYLEKVLDCSTAA